jgi:manganese efflux pump family protein
MNFTDILSVVFIALGLSADCFAVTLGISGAAKAFSWKNVLRLALAFGIFQMGMPLVGWLLGQTIVQVIAGYDHWIAFALLLYVGGRMIWEFAENKTESETTDISKWTTLLTLAIATSIDALAVGLSFALLKINIIIAAAVIGIVAFSVTILSYWLGKRIGAMMGRWALLIGALILVGIGARILITHMVE